MTQATDHRANAVALAERLFGAMLESMDLMAVYIGHSLGYYGFLAEHGSVVLDPGIQAWLCRSRSLVRSLSLSFAVA